MWARVTEILLGFWLVISPFVFQHDPNDHLLWINDLTCAGLVMLLATLSFHARLDKAHLGHAVVGAWLLVGVLGADPATMPPALRNHAVVALVLLMLAVVPTRSRRPPSAWQRFYEGRAFDKSDRQDM